MEIVRGRRNRQEDNADVSVAEVVGSNPTRSISYCEGITALN
jgi:hypothetical protein